MDMYKIGKFISELRKEIRTHASGPCGTARHYRQGGFKMGTRAFIAGLIYYVASL